MKSSEIHYFPLFFLLFLALLMPAQSSATIINDHDSLEIRVDGLQMSEKLDAYIKNAKLFQNSNLEKALLNCLEALTLAKSLNAEEKKLEIIFLLGEIYYYSGSYENSLSYLFQALNQPEITSNYRIASQVNLLIADVYSKMQIEHEAVAYYNNTLQLAEIVNDTIMIANTYNKMGEYYLLQNDFDNANNYFNGSMEINESINNIEGEAINLMNMAKLAKKTEKYNQAQSFLVQALGMFKELKDNYQITNTLIELGDVKIKLQEYQQALTLLNEAKENAHQLKAPPLLSEAYKFLADAYTALSDTNQAYIYMKLYTAYLDSIEMEARSKDLLQMQAKWSMEQKTLEIRQLADNTQKSWLFSLSLIIILLFAVCILFYFRYKDKRQKAEFLKEKNTQILEKQNELEAINEELKIAKAKAQESDKLKTAFLANISHEVRTPLNAILGFSELMKMPTFSDEKRESFFIVIQRNIHQLLELLNDILDVAKIEAAEINLLEQSFNLQKLMDELYHYFERQRIKNKKGHIEFIVEYDLVGVQNEIVLDKERLYQILENLIDNAFKFTHKGSVVFGYKLVNANSVEIYVSDTGIGISPSKQEKIFLRFSQADYSISREYGGSGLGLAISKGLVELMGGHMYIDSTPNVGTKFSFTIPYRKKIN